MPPACPARARSYRGRDTASFIVSCGLTLWVPGPEVRQCLAGHVDGIAKANATARASETEAFFYPLMVLRMIRPDRVLVKHPGLVHPVVQRPVR